MNTEEKYLFDLMGFLVVKQVLAREEVDELNALIDSYDLWRKAESGGEPAWVNDPNFMTLGALHTWDEPFRRLLAHPKIMPYLKSLVGPKFRYDHGHALLMRPGAKQLGLHGGNTPWDPAQEYRYRDGEILNGLVVVSYALSDAGADDGGFAVVPGSHKANFAVPQQFISFDEDRAMGLARARGGRRRDHLQRGVHARHVAVARSSRAAEPALQVRARAFGVGVAVSVAGGRARDRLLRGGAADSRPAVRGARAGRVRGRVPEGRGLGTFRRRIAKAIDLRAQPSRVVGCDALEHAHAFLELRDQRVALRERSLETCATRASPLPVDRLTHLASGPASLTHRKLAGPNQEHPKEHSE